MSKELPLTPALSPSEGARENCRQPVGESERVKIFVNRAFPLPLPTHEPLLSRLAATLSSPSEGEEREGRGVVRFRGTNRELGRLMESLPGERVGVRASVNTIPFS